MGIDISMACDAIREGRLLDLRYDGYWRSVEVHCVGWSKKQQAIMRVWQVSGGSVSNEPVGWKLLKLDDVTSAELSDAESLAPRPGFNPNDPAIPRVACSA